MGKKGHLTFQKGHLILYLFYFYYYFLIKSEDDDIIYILKLQL